MDFDLNMVQAQKDKCTQYAAKYLAAEPLDKLGIAKASGNSAHIINGLRHTPDPGTCGWFIWTGQDDSTEDDFFQPLHVQHLEIELPAVLPYLGLGPGWRFLIAPDYEDVWFDPKLRNSVVASAFKINKSPCLRSDRKRQRS